MKYIKVLGQDVLLGGVVSTPEMEAEGWFMYDKELPKYNSSTKLIWDSELEEIIVNMPYEINKKLELLKVDYSKSNLKDISYMNTTFQADEYSQNLIVSVLSSGSVPDNFFWLDKENNPIAITFEELQGLSYAILERNQFNFIKYQELKTQASTATSVKELDDVIW